jgi:hypothetical protein
MKKFGKLEKVDLHELWHGEATDFTQWLSEEDTIVELGDAIGMELKVQEQEQKTEAFQASVVCKDVQTDLLVLIRIQLEQTNHTPFGQLMTVAAGLDATTIIWIAKAFSEEHWVLLSWLNKISDESIKFFGIEIEAYKIGDSLPAPNFNIVVKPIGWTKQVKKSTTIPKLTDIELLQLEYWHGLKNFLEENNSFVKLLGTPPKSSFNIAHDKGRYFLSVTVNAQDVSLNIWLNIIGNQAKDDFTKLYEIGYKDSLEEINENIMWNKIQTKLGCSVSLKSFADFTERNDWTNQFAWFKENLEKFDKFFRPKVRQL